MQQELIFYKIHSTLGAPDTTSRRYIEMLFGFGTRQAKHVTDGDSK
jgi:hypothetical protein